MAEEFPKRLKLNKPFGQEGDPQSVTLGRNHPADCPGGPEAYYSDSERFVTVAEAIEILSRFFPHGLAKSFLLSEIKAGRIGVVGLPWVIVSTPAYPADSPKGKRLQESEPGFLKNVTRDGRWTFGEPEIELEFKELAATGDAFIDLDAGDVVLASTFYADEEHGAESVETWTEHIRLRRSVLEAYVDGTPRNPASRDETAPATADHPRRKAGRKPLPITDLLWAELARRAFRGEFEAASGPITQADACRMMSDWLSQQELSMSDETLRDKVRALWSALGWR